MEYDLNFLEPQIIDARRNKDTDSLTRYLLRYLCSFDDNIIYAPQGVSKMIQSTLDTSKRTSYRLLDSLEDRDFFHKFDEFSLQLNDQFSRKGTKPFRYKGCRLLYTQDEIEFLNLLQSMRDNLWALRGKRKIRTSRDDDMTMQMKKRFEELSEQNKELLTKQNEMLDLMKDLVAGKDVTEKAKSHLFLVTVSE